MKYTNNMNLPEPFFKAVSEKQSGGSHSDYGVTTLLSGACAIILAKRHDADISVDVSDCMNTVFGTAVHGILEKYGDQSRSEVHITYEHGGKTVGGRMDYIDGDELVDWKTAGVWKIKMADFADWKKQGAIYAFIYNLTAEHKAKKVRFIAFLKDWSPRAARFGVRDGYPQLPIAQFTFDVTPELEEQAKMYVDNKVEKLIQYENVADECLPPCNEEERWSIPHKFALMQKGKKKALKLYDSEDEALQAVGDNEKLYVEERPEEPRKCTDYCNVSQWCPWYQKFIKEHGDSAEGEAE